MPSVYAMTFTPIPNPDARPEPAEPRVMVPMTELELYEEVAFRASILLAALKAAYGPQYPGQMHEAVALDRVLVELREMRK